MEYTALLSAKLVKVAELLKSLPARTLNSVYIVECSSSTEQNSSKLANFLANCIFASVIGFLSSAVAFDADAKLVAAAWLVWTGAAADVGVFSALVEAVDFLALEELRFAVMSTVFTPG